MADDFASIDHDRPTCFLAYTIKGWGTPIAGHKDNHGGLMTRPRWPSGSATWACRRARSGRSSPPSKDRTHWKAFLDRSRSSPGAGGATPMHGSPPAHRARDRPRDLHPGRFGKILDDLAKTATASSPRGS
jgi:pyruvate dehydrogenase E1 component